MKRVVVTGLGLVTPLGVGVRHVWNRLIQGQVAVKKISEVLAPSSPETPSGPTNYPYAEELLRVLPQLPSRVAAFVPRGPGEGNFRVEDWVDRTIRQSTSPFIHFALAATKQAIDDAKWTNLDEKQRDRTGVAIGSGIGCVEESYEAGRLLHTQGIRKLSPHGIPRLLINLAAGHVSIQHGYLGPNHAVSTACATGLHAIGDASRMIAFGDADVMIAGGSEASITPISLALFSRLRALSTQYNETPAVASRPFDKDRAGFVMGEGAGVVVLEEYEHALKRGAKIYCEVGGYGMAGDAHHITAPDPSGRGAALAMQRALSHARILPQQVAYVNAHATSTPMGDAIEIKALRSIFGPHINKVAISSTKGSIGHLLGSAGSVEAIFSILALCDGVFPPTANLVNPDPEYADLNLVPVKAQSYDWHKEGPSAVLTNSFGFGGTNASVCFKRLR